MICQFHGGTTGTLHSWHLVEKPASGCVHCIGNAYCHGLPTASNSSCCVNPIASCHGTEMTLSHVTGTWSLLTHLSSAARQSSRCHRNELFPGDGSRRVVSRKNPTSFTITDILANGPSDERDPSTRSSTKSIVRPWDDDDDDDVAVRCNDQGGGVEGREEGGNLRISEASEADEGVANAAVGRNGPRSGSGHVSQRKTDCPLDALQRMATRTQFDWMDKTTSGYTSDGESRFNTTK